MTAIYVLARNGENYGNYDMVGWFDSREKAEAAAIEREWEKHRANLALAPSPGIKYLSPDETSYREFWVQELHQL